MKTLKLNLTSLLISITFLSSLAIAKTVLISDIDDTIKISHVLDLQDAAVNAFLTDNVFLGMPDLYQLISENVNDLHFFYVTSAPKMLMEGSHTRFLAQHKFPYGMVFLRGNIMDKNFKLYKIRKILNIMTPTQVILIGDNGESDTLIYHQLQNDYPTIQFHTYIHQLYSINSIWETGSRLMENQVGFVTPVEIALDLSKNKILPAEKTRIFMQKLIPLILQYRFRIFSPSVGAFFPDFMDCQDFIWSGGESSSDLLIELQLKLQRRCSSNY